MRQEKIWDLSKMGFLSSVYIYPRVYPNSVNYVYIPATFFSISFMFGSHKKRDLISLFFGLKTPGKEAAGSEFPFHLIAPFLFQILCSISTSSLLFVCFHRTRHEL